MIKQIRWLALLLVALVSPAGVQGDDEKAISGDLKKMQGAWVHTNAQGEENRWVFEGDSLRSMTGNGVYVSKVKLDPKANPQPTVDLKITAAPDDSVGKTALAIYKLEGDTLKLCVAHPGVATRPTEFKPTEGEAFVIELKRAK